MRVYEGEVRLLDTTTWQQKQLKLHSIADAALGAVSGIKLPTRSWQLFHKRTVGLTQEKKYRHMQLMHMDVWDCIAA